MTPVPVTPALLHDLVAGSHAEGITALAVACTVTHDDHILLLAEPGRDFIDTTWQPPVGPVLPGEALIDALPKTLTLAGLTIDEVIGYMGHHDHHDDGETTRVFCFAVTVTDPDSICRLAHIGHRWVDLGDLPDLPPPAGQHRMALASWVPASHHESPQRLAQALRAWAHGLYAAEAGTELLIRHAAWLHRSDFRDRFVDWDISITNDTDMATIDWPGAITALGAGELLCSGGEDRMLRLAASLVDGIPVDLRDALIGLDDFNIDLVSQAVLHVGGHRPHARF